MEKEKEECPARGILLFVFSELFSGKLKTFPFFIRYIKCKSSEGVGEIDAKENLIRLVNQYQNLVFSICLKLTGDYFTSEDITQDTFITAYQHWSDFDGNNEKAWICRIASNKCIDYLRKAGRKHTLTDGELKEEGTLDNDPLKMYMGKAVVKEIETACKNLPAPYRDVALLHFIQGFTAKEIAKRKELNPKTVQTQIYRAREMLKKSLRREDFLS